MSNMAIIEHHIWILTALAEVPLKVLILNSCFRCLKYTINVPAGLAEL